MAMAVVVDGGMCRFIIPTHTHTRTHPSTGHIVYPKSILCTARLYTMATRAFEYSSIPHAEE